MDDKIEDLPEGFCYATSEDLALELGKTKEEAKAMDTRLERLAGNNLRLAPPPKGI